MTRRRGADQRVRLTVPGPSVTRTITPRQIENYLRWTRGREMYKAVHLPSLRDPAVPLAELIGEIAAYEGRSPGEVLDDIAAGRGLLSYVRSTKRWPPA